MPPPYRKPVLVVFRVPAIATALGSLNCMMGPRVMDETCLTGWAAMNTCSSGCAANESCTTGGDACTGACTANQCCAGDFPAPPIDNCVTGSSARWNCASGGIFDQPYGCTSNCVNSINCTNGS